MAEVIQQHHQHHGYPLETRGQCTSPHFIHREQDYMLGLAKQTAYREEACIGDAKEKKLGEGEEATGLEPEETDLKLGLGTGSDGGGGRDMGKGQCRRASAKELMGEWGSKRWRAAWSSMEMGMRNRVQIGEEEMDQGPPPTCLPPKSHVVAVAGWPPLRPSRRPHSPLSIRRSASPEEDIITTAHPTFFVKVHMDGIPIGRKVNLHAYNSYQALLTALQEMFHGPHVGPNAYLFKFQLTYEDKDGDWMLVGDVPWEMFVKTVKRLRIMRGQSS